MHPLSLANKKRVSTDKPVIYTHNKYSVFCEGIEIARAYVGEKENEVRILQGMPRMETWDKIFVDCPEYAKENDMNPNRVPKLFSQRTCAERVKRLA